MHCCCPPASRAVDTIARTCCDDRSVPALPSVDASESAPKTVAAPLLAILSLSALYGRSEGGGACVGAMGREARAGPDEPLYRAHSVFLL